MSSFPTICCMRHDLISVNYILVQLCSFQVQFFAYASVELMASREAEPPGLKGGSTTGCWVTAANAGMSGSTLLSPYRCLVPFGML